MLTELCLIIFRDDGSDALGKIIQIAIVTNPGAH